MFNEKNLARLAELGSGAPDPWRAFVAFDQAALAEGALPRKIKELIAVAVALTTQCAYCLNVHREAALAAGATDEELAEVTFVAAALRAGAAVTHGTHLLPPREGDS